MPRDIVYFDLETQRTANDAGGWDRKGNMQMSIGVTYSTRSGHYEIFDESRVHDLIERLRQADLVVGFNVLNFDYHVLMGYTVLDLAHELPTADLMLDMERKLGHRLGLDAIAQATLRRAQDRREPRRDSLVARRSPPRDRGILLLRCESDATRARARLPPQGAFLP